MNAPTTFRIAARAILELGAELISSDGIALYELLKNSIDAGADQVRIDVNVALRFSAYSVLMAKVDAYAEVIAQAREVSDTDLLAIDRMETDAIRTMRDEVIAALEHDASEDCAAQCDRMLSGRTSITAFRRSFERLYDRINWISVTDAGEGMSLEDLREVYLTIGTRSRQKDKPRLGGPAPARIYLGEKGVGRLSTMRLGGLLHVETTTSGETHFNRLDVDWDWFSHDSDRLLGEIKIRPRRGTPKADQSSSGTTVKILRLRSDWTVAKFQEIVLQEFSRLIDPFESRRASRLLRLYYNGTRHHPAEIERRLFEIAHAECKVAFRYEDGKPVLRGQINYRLRGREKTFVLQEPEIRGFIARTSWPALMSLGPFDMEFWWYNRRSLTEIPGLGKKRDVQRRIARWAGGLMLFRDGYRINPYGGSDDDWLSLDKKAFSSKGFKLNRQQVIGRVSISWKNPHLVDQTNREGLTDTPEKAVFVILLQQVLFTEFKAFLDRCDREARVQEVTTLEDLQAHVERAREDISRRIREVIVRVPAERGALTEVDRMVGTLNGYIDQARELAQEYESDRSKFVYLAGIGLMVEFILHELGRATSHTLDTLKSIEAGTAGQSTNLMLPATFRTLDDQLTTLVKRIETLDPLSTSRRQIKEDFDAYEVVRQVVEGRQDQARRHGVSFEGDFDEGSGFIVRGVRGMFIQILENLIANSFYWLGVQRDIEPGLRARIEIDIDRDERSISVTDNGTGVDPSAASEIFEAFISHRPAKEGKGLGLYISREIANYHDWSLDILRENTVRKDRYNTFVLDLPATSS